MCGYRSGDQNNWLFTQHISKAAPAVDSYNVRVFVNMTARFLGCFISLGCTPQLEILTFISNSQQEKTIYTNTTQYSGDDFTPSNILRDDNIGGVSSVHQQYHFDLNTNQDGFYFAIHDHSGTDGSTAVSGTCVHVERLIIYRHECPAKAVGLVRYPATQAPISGSVSVTTECASNSHTSGRLAATCDSEGYWTDHSTLCECDLGYSEMIETQTSQNCTGELVSPCG